MSLRNCPGGADAAQRASRRVPARLLRSGAGAPVILLHGWPGDRTDYRLLAPELAGSCDVVVPDLRGFGESDKHPADPAEQYSAAAQARSVAGPDP